MLKFKVTTLDEVDEKFKGLYTQDSNGGYVLEVQGSVSKEKLNEFRANNDKLKGELEKLRGAMKAVEGIDPEQYKNMQSKLKDYEEKKLMDQGEFEKVLEQRLVDAKNEHEKHVREREDKIKNLISQNETLKTRNDQSTLRDFVRTALTNKFRVKENAYDIIMKMAEDVWKVKEDFSVVAEDTAGLPLYNKDGHTPKTMDEWITDVLAKHPYLSEDSKGGGATGSSSTSPLDPQGKHVFADGSMTFNNDFSKNAEKIASGEIKVVRNQ